METSRHNIGVESFWRSPVETKLENDLLVCQQLVPVSTRPLQQKVKNIYGSGYFKSLYLQKNSKDRKGCGVFTKCLKPHSSIICPCFSFVGQKDWSQDIKINEKHSQSQ